MRDALTRLLKVKSLVTLALTAGMLLLLSGLWEPGPEIVSLYSTCYGATITYFFTRRDDSDGGGERPA